MECSWDSSLKQWISLKNTVSCIPNLYHVWSNASLSWPIPLLGLFLWHTFHYVRNINSQFKVMLMDCFCRISYWIWQSFWDMYCCELLAYLSPYKQSFCIIHHFKFHRKLFIDKYKFLKYSRSLALVILHQLQRISDWCTHDGWSSQHKPLLQWETFTDLMHLQFL